MLRLYMKIQSCCSRLPFVNDDSETAIPVDRASRVLEPTRCSISSDGARRYRPPRFPETVKCFNEIFVAPVIGTDSGIDSRGSLKRSVLFVATIVMYNCRIVDRQLSL